MTTLALLVRATVILAAGLGVATASRRVSASTRSLWLAVTFAALLLFPIATATLPPVRLVIPVPTSTPMVIRRAPVSVHGNTSIDPVSPAAPDRRASMSLREGLVGLWLLGAALSNLPFWLAVVGASRSRRRGRLWPRGADALGMLVRSRSTVRPVDVICDPALRVPCTLGFVRPVIAFPVDAADWSDDDLLRVLIHEYEHVRRGDWITLLMARCVCSLYWFHPLVWLAFRRLRVETERACDDAVVRAADAPAYAEQLVTLAARLSRGASAPVLSIAGRSELATRVSSILDAGRRRAPTTVGCRWLTFTCGVAIAGATAVMQPVSARGQAAQQQSTELGEILPLEAGNMGREVEGGARLSGILYDPFGRPLSGVILGIESLVFGDPPLPPRSTPFFRATRTDANGRYVFERVPPGLYGLAAPTTDFVPGEQIILRAADHITRDIHMRIEPATAMVTVCRDCQSRTNPFDLPDSIRQELERDEQMALSASVAAPEPMSRLLTGEVAAPYPESLRNRGLEGHVVVEGVIAADGAGRAMRVTSATDAALGAAALDVLAAERWKPAFVRGVAVDAPFRVEVHFILK
jgi:TonB family protein